MPIGIETIYGIAFLVAMLAVGAGLTWLGLTDGSLGVETTEADAEPAD